MYPRHAFVVLLLYICPAALSFLPSTLPPYNGGARRRFFRPETSYKASLDTSKLTLTKSTAHAASPPSFGEGDSDAEARSFNRRLVVTSLLTSSLLLNNGNRQAAVAAEAASSSYPSSFDLPLNLPPTIPPSSVSSFFYRNLKVLIYQLPTTASMFCTLSVPVGSTSQTFPGSAHLTEHCLFLGSEKYGPTFERTLSALGGRSNAFTEPEYTTYYYTSPPSPAVLDRFARFVIDPTLSLESVTSEVTAIQSEHEKNLLNDAFRLYEVSKKRVNPLHPLSQFYTGDRKTMLRGGTLQSLRDDLKSFYSGSYGLRSPSLVLVSPRPIKESRDMLESAFLDMPSRDSPEPPVPQDAGRAPPYSSPGSIPGLRSVVWVKPVKDLRQVSLTFPVLYRGGLTREEVRRLKPTTYLCHFLGDEGKGSLLSYLKGKGWASGLGAGGEFEVLDHFTVDVAVDLTEEGMKNVDAVVEAVFGFMRQAMMTPEKGLFDDVLRSGEVAHGYYQVTSPEDWSQEMAREMLTSPSEAWFEAGRATSGTGLKSEFPDGEYMEVKSAYDKVLGEMRWDNCLVTVVSKDFRPEAKEEIYGTPYKAEPFTKGQIAAWSSPGSLDARLMPRNEYIPSPRVGKKGVGGSPYPTKVAGLTGEDELFWSETKKYSKPKSAATFLLQSPVAYDSPAKAATARVWAAAVQRSMQEFSYPLRLAGYGFSVEAVPRGWEFTVSGWTERLPCVWRDSLTEFLAQDLDDSTFKDLKDEVKRSLESLDKNQPYTTAGYYGSLLRAPERFAYGRERVLAALEGVQVEDVKEYFKPEGRVRALVQGGLSEADAKDMLVVFKATLGVRDGPSTDFFTPLRIRRAREVWADTEDSNVASMVTLDFPDSSAFPILVSALSERFYDDLRTKKGLGYVCNLSGRRIKGGRVMNLLVQSQKSRFDEIEDWISEAEKTLMTVSDDEYASLVKTARERLSEDDQRLGQEFERNWSEVASGEERWDRKKAECEGIKNVTREDVLKLWKARGPELRVKVGKGGKRGVDDVRREIATEA